MVHHVWYITYDVVRIRGEYVHNSRYEYESPVCGLHVKQFFLLVDIQHSTPCPCRFFTINREIQAP